MQGLEVIHLELWKCEMNKIIDILLHEHEEILQFISKLRAMCLDFVQHNKIDIDEFYRSIEFIKHYADERHHQKEEEVVQLEIQLSQTVVHLDRHIAFFVVV